MEVQYTSAKFPDCRPDGLLAANRGTTNWAAFIEAKSATSRIRPEQILDYIELASQLDVDSIITFSNEFARSPEELPYHIAGNRLRKRSIYHFAWADIRTFLERVRSQEKLEYA